MESVLKRSVIGQWYPKKRKREKEREREEKRRR
jgi:hypothetical protein